MKTQSMSFFVYVKEPLAGFISMAALDRACANLNQAASDSLLDPRTKDKDMMPGIIESSSTSPPSFVSHESCYFLRL